MENLVNPIVDHDVKPGRLDYCQICGSHDLELVIDCGHQPLCDTLLRAEDLYQPEAFYPLRLMRCTRCANAQLDYIVSGEQVYHPAYPYRSGITREISEYQKAMSTDLILKLGLDERSLVVDIGSNDGTLLGGFKRHGMRAIGIEPTNIAAIAREAGVETIQEFFTEAIAHDIVKEHGRASLVTATNVFAHMATLGEVMRGIVELIGDRGVFVLENHYLLDVIQRNQYDTVYHEHIRTYCLKALMALFDQYGMEVFRAERVPRYGGNIRAFVAARGRRPVDGSIAEILRLEQDAGLFGPEVYARFRQNVEKTRLDLLSLLLSAKQSGHSVAGKSCPGRCATLLNYVGIGPHLLP
jgi:2-polyprenyl-3-methyl-5-hydroxy-6-metoxy-1,4-benzoquinol methylase